MPWTPSNICSAEEKKSKANIKGNHLFLGGPLLIVCSCTCIYVILIMYVQYYESLLFVFRHSLNDIHIIHCTSVLYRCVHWCWPSFITNSLRCLFQCIRNKLPVLDFDPWMCGGNYAQHLIQEYGHHIISSKLIHWSGW